MSTHCVACDYLLSENYDVNENMCPTCLIIAFRTAEIEGPYADYIEEAYGEFERMDKEDLPEIISLDELLESEEGWGGRYDK